MARRLRHPNEAANENINGYVVLNLKAAKITRFATILSTLIGSATLCVAPLVFAQSNKGSIPSVWETVNIPGPPSSAADELLGPPTSATDGFSGTADDSAGSAASPTHREEVDETNSEAPSGDGQVLEIPQPVDSAQSEAPNGDDNSPAQVSSDVEDNESAQAGDDLGGLNHYQGQNAEVSSGYLVSIPVPIAVPVGPGYAGVGIGAPVQPIPGMGGGPISLPFPGGGFRRSPPIILRPGFAGILSTSPMGTSPRGSAAIPGGWWTRTH
jgi:hypothetical protein